MFFLKKEPKTFLWSFAAKRYANCVIVLKSTITHNDFFCILTGAEKICNLLFNQYPYTKQMAMLGSSKLQFLFVCEQKQLARVLPESSAVICAKFSGISTSYTATITKCLKKLFAPLFAKSGIFFSKLTAL